MVTGMENDPLFREALAEAFAYDDTCRVDYENRQASQQRKFVTKSAGQMVYRTQENARTEPAAKFATREFVEQIASDVAELIGAETGKADRQMKKRIAALHREIVKLRAKLALADNGKANNETNDTAVIRLGARR
jgi:uncharacterized small protein (DUF1192 family)